jgi:hypothetical protein
LDLTLWQLAASNFDLPKGSIVAAKNARTKTFQNQTSLNIEVETVFYVDPNIPQAKPLKDYLISKLGK